MQQTRILIISYHTCPLADEPETEVGGMNIYVMELSRALADRGYAIDIFTRSISPHNQQIVEISKNLRVIHIPAGPQQTFNKKELRQYIPEFITRLSTFLTREKHHYQLINCHYYYSGIIGLALRKYLHLPMTMTFHTLALMKQLIAKTDLDKEDILRIESEMQLTKEAQLLIATGGKDALYLQRLYNCQKDKIAVITPGVDPALFHPIVKIDAKRHIGADPAHTLALFVGRIEPLKGIDVLLYAIKILVEEDVNLRLCLWVVGRDMTVWKKEIERLEQIRKLLEITTIVKFVGMQSREELPYYYNAADIVVMPSLYESFGMSTLEAMACGTPVITTDVTGISELFGTKHNPRIVSAGNPILLAKRIKQLIQKNEYQQKISPVLFRKAQSLTWDAAAERFIRLIKSKQLLHD